MRRARLNLFHPVKLMLRKFICFILISKLIVVLLKLFEKFEYSNVLTE